MQTFLVSGANDEQVLLSLLPFACLTLAGTTALASPAGPDYHLIKSIRLDKSSTQGEYFDYITVDSSARRVYLTHGTEVIVLDADNFAVVGTITGLKRCHGVLALPELGKGFITDGDAGQVVVFDLKTLKTTGVIKNAPGTDSIIYDSASRLVFTFNGASKNATVIDPVKERVIKVIDLGGGPEYPTSDGKGFIYDDIEENNQVAAIDTHAFTVKAPWPVAPAGASVHFLPQRKRRPSPSGRLFLGHSVCWCMAAKKQRREGKQPRTAYLGRRGSGDALEALAQTNVMTQCKG
jgi:hypothetical protein